MSVAASEMESAEKPLSPEVLAKIDAYWRACNYLAAGMIYLQENPFAVTFRPRRHWRQQRCCVNISMI